jgi:hypothetical protein
MIINMFYKLIGLLFLLIVKLKNVFLGYTNPKPFPISNINRCIDYDFHVVGEWLKYLKIYAGEDCSVKGKEILELGPGSDIGTGLILLSKDALRYNAVDVNNLIKDTPIQFYRSLLERIQSQSPSIDIKMLFYELELSLNNRNDKLNYVCDKNFDLEKTIKGSQIDIIFSQAAFEHFDQMEKTIAQLTKIAKPKAILIAQIDLMTHSRWIRVKDPLNIYRYSSFIYGLFSYKAMPNRLRPYNYIDILKRNGWCDIQIISMTVMDKVKFDAVKPFLNSQYKDDKNQMEYLSIVLGATRKP